MTKEDRLKGICYEINRELNQGKTIEINFNYGETVVLTYKGKRVCSRSGGGYDKLGAGTRFLIDLSTGGGENLFVSVFYYIFAPSFENGSRT